MADYKYFTTYGFSTDNYPESRRRFLLRRFEALAARPVHPGQEDTGFDIVHRTGIKARRMPAIGAPPPAMQEAIVAERRQTRSVRLIEVQT